MVEARDHALRRGTVSARGVHEKKKKASFLTLAVLELSPWKHSSFSKGTGKSA